MRVIIRACAADLPGHPRDRENTAAKLFCEQVLKRPFHRDLHELNYDFSHTTPYLDTAQATVRRWFICDLNVTRELSGDELRSLPHKVYNMSLQNGSW